MRANTGKSYTFESILLSSWKDVMESFFIFFVLWFICHVIWPKIPVMRWSITKEANYINILSSIFRFYFGSLFWDTGLLCNFRVYSAVLQELFRRGIWWGRHPRSFLPSYGRQKALRMRQNILPRWLLILIRFFLVFFQGIISFKVQNLRLC